MDVHDFLDGEVKVKAEGEEVVVEGRLERREKGGSSVSSHSFTRRFSLPPFTDMAAITSVMSSDGILTITAPKMVSTSSCTNHIHRSERQSQIATRSTLYELTFLFCFNRRTSLTKGLLLFPSSSKKLRAHQLPKLRIRMKPVPLKIPARNPIAHENLSVKQ